MTVRVCGICPAIASAIAAASSGNSDPFLAVPAKACCFCSESAARHTRRLQLYQARTPTRLLPPGNRLASKCGGSGVATRPSRRHAAERPSSAAALMFLSAAMCGSVGGLCLGGRAATAQNSYSRKAIALHFAIVRATPCLIRTTGVVAPAANMRAAAMTYPASGSRRRRRRRGRKTSAMALMRVRAEIRA
jgi:hypothetical protein